MGLDALGHHWRDVGYGFRALRKKPGFALAAILTLALGIGANTAMFSVVDSLIFRPLPYMEANRLVMISERLPNIPRTTISEANYLDLRARSMSFSNLAAFSQTPMNLAAFGPAERLEGVRMTWDGLEMLGAVPVRGRSFLPADDRPGAAPVAILSYPFWQRRFGGDPGVIGRPVRVNGTSCTIIGVLGPQFRFFLAPDIFMPLALNPAKATRDFGYLFVAGRLKPGVSLALARQEMARVAHNLEADYPKDNEGWGLNVEPAREAVLATALPRGSLDAIWVLCGAVGFVLLIACVNVANLLLVRAAARRREMALRASLGAARGRLISQLLSESLLLALSGGAVGVALGALLVNVVHKLVPAFARAGFAEITIDWRVVGFTALLSIATGVCFGIYPAWRASGVDLHTDLKEGGRGSGGSRSQTRFRSTLVVLEVALSLVLLAGAGLMLRSITALRNANFGFRQDHLLTARLSMPEDRFGPAPLRGFYRAVLENAEAIPGVQGASLTLGLPLRGTLFGNVFQVASQPRVPESQMHSVPIEAVTSDFFSVMGIRMRKGRCFTDADNEKGRRVAIVNEAFCRRYLPGQSPIGEKVLMQSVIAGSRDIGPFVDWEIVGVVGDVTYQNLTARRGTPEVYLSLMQSPWPGAALVLRTGGDPLAVANAARSVLGKVDPDIPLTAVQSMDQIAADSLMTPRIETGLIAGFAAVALIMAALGIYGVISYSVAQERHDLGIRMALGAGQGGILNLVLRRSLSLAAAGLLFGLLGALGFTRWLDSLLFQVRPGDPLTLVAVCAVLAFVALLAGLIPAIRASRIDPAVALRCE